MWTRITTPYLDRHNDYLLLYSRAEEDGEWTITDDGSAFGDMATIGWANVWNDPQVVDILARWEVNVEGYALVKCVRSDDYYLGIHAMVQTMLALDRFVTAQTLLEREGA